MTGVVVLGQSRGWNDCFGSPVHPVVWVQWFGPGEGLSAGSGRVGLDATLHLPDGTVSSTAEYMLRSVQVQ